MKAGGFADPPHKDRNDEIISAWAVGHAGLSLATVGMMLLCGFLKFTGLFLWFVYSLDGYLARVF